MYNSHFLAARQSLEFHSLISSHILLVVTYDSCGFFMNKYEKALAELPSECGFPLSCTIVWLSSCSSPGYLYLPYDPRPLVW